MVQPVTKQRKPCTTRRLCRYLVLTTAALVLFWQYNESSSSLLATKTSLLLLLDRPPGQQQHPNLSRQYIRKNRRGRVVMRKIDKVFAADLHDISDDQILERAKDHSLDNHDNKQEILSILRDAGINQGMDQATIRMLPTWKDVTTLYYSSLSSTNNNSHSSVNSSIQPIVLGHCDPVANSNKTLGVAGLFNSGTNALTYYLRANLRMPLYQNESHSGILTQVPWDKHWFSHLRYNHTIDWMAAMDKTQVLPIVMVRDPLTWYHSMRKSPYLVEFANRSHPMSAVSMPKMMTGSSIQTWPTLFHLWNEWYQDYVSSNLPFILIRVEDLWFRPRATVQRIQECTGAAWRDASGTITYVVDTSKWEHVRFEGPQSTLVSSIIKHGNPTRRTRNLTQSELQEVSNILSDGGLMEQFGYNKASLLDSW